MTRHALVLSLLLGLSIPAFAKPGDVTTLDGRTYSGDVTESEDGKFVIITTKLPTGAPVEMKIDKRNVSKLVYTKAFEDEIKEQAAKLDPTDVAGRIKMARWAYDKNKFETARELLEQATKIDPSNKEASEFLDQVIRRIELEKKSTNGKPAVAGTTQPATQQATTNNTTPSATPIATAVKEKKTLSPADINTIRQKELRKGEVVNVRFDNNVQKKFVDANEINPGEFNRLSVSERALQILSSEKHAAYAKDIKITSDPMSMREFRQLQATVLAGCATSGCHGGGTSGNFALIAPAEGEAAAYTNFFILQSYTHKFAGIDQPMLDRVSPERSLLLHFGLPNDQTDTPHPPVAGYKAIFKGRNDPRYDRIAKWLGQTLSPITPTYGITYPPAPEEKK